MFYDIFAFTRFASGDVFFMVYELNGSPHLSIFRSSFRMIVFKNSPFKIGGNPSIERVISTTEDVGEVAHRGAITDYFRRISISVIYLVRVSEFFSYVRKIRRFPIRKEVSLSQNSRDV